MSENFFCISCGNTFNTKAVLNKKHGVIEPVPCPKCKSVCTRPDSFLPSVSNWIYEEIWNDKIWAQRKATIKTNPEDSDGIFYRFLLKNKWFGLNKKDCTVDIELWDTKMREKVQENFGILYFEKVLFYRDTSFTNNGNEGLVLTSYGIHFRPNSKFFFFDSWQNIISEARIKGDSLLLYNRDKKINMRIPVVFFAKGYNNLAEKKKSEQKKFICEFLNELIKSKSTEDVDIDKLLNDVVYKRPKNFIEPPESIISYFNVDELHVPCEDSKLIKEFESTLNSFEGLKNSIYSTLCELEKKYDEWKTNVNRQAVHAAINGYKGNRPEEIVLAAIIALVGNVYGEIEKAQNKKRVDRIMQKYEAVKKQYLEDYKYFIAFQISKQHQDIIERRNLVCNILNQKVINLDTTNLSLLDKEKENCHVQMMLFTAEKCFHMYCKLIVRQIDLVNILLKMIGKEGTYQKLDFRNIISYEIFKMFANKKTKDNFNIPVSLALYNKHL